MLNADDDSDWSEILSYVYEEGFITVENDRAVDQREEIFSILSESTEIEQDIDDVKETVHRMIDSNLLYTNVEDNKRTLALTKTGFNIAHDRKMATQEQRRESKRHQRQYSINRSIAALTLGLVFIGVLQGAITGMVGKDAPWKYVIFAIVLGGIAVLAIGYVIKDDLFGRQ